MTTEKLGHGLTISPEAATRLRADSAHVGPEIAVDAYLNRLGESWGFARASLRKILLRYLNRR